MIKSLRRVAAACVLAGVSGLSMAGPVILGGDDLTDHGSRTAGGVNLAGWLYIEKAVSNVLSGVTRAGTIITTDIIALGSIANPNFNASNVGGAIGSVANVLGKTVTYIDGAAAINQFFIDLANGTINPNMLWFAGTGAVNNLNASEGAALTANAAAINSGSSAVFMGSFSAKSSQFCRLMNR